MTPEAPLQNTLCGRSGMAPKRRRRHWRWPLAVAAAVGLTSAASPSASAIPRPSTFLGGLHTLSTTASTVPTNGDINPYGIATVPTNRGRLVAGDVLVSNFNGHTNQQGTGSTIVEISPRGAVKAFAQINPTSGAAHACGGVGLTTALVVLRSGWVVVGSLPTTDGTAATATSGCLFVLDSYGKVARTIAGGPINGPWDMTALEDSSHVDLFVTNVLNGTVRAAGQVVNRGTVVRVDLDVSGEQVPRVRGESVIGSGFSERSDPAALVVGPTGLALGASGSLYVADTVANRIAAIPNATSRTSTASAGRDVTTGGALVAPLGLTLAPNGDVLTVNGGNGKAVEITPAGAQVATRVLDRSGTPPGAGALFGLAIDPAGGLYYVDDATNTLSRLH